MEQTVKNTFYLEHTGYFVIHFWLCATSQFVCFMEGKMKGSQGLRQFVCHTYPSYIMSWIVLKYFRSRYQNIHPSIKRSCLLLGNMAHCFFTCLTNIMVIVFFFFTSCVNRVYYSKKLAFVYLALV